MIALTLVVTATAAYGIFVALDKALEWLDRRREAHHARKPA
jgi:hypothetical protein